MSEEESEQPVQMPSLAEAVNSIFSSLGAATAPNIELQAMQNEYSKQLIIKSQEAFMAKASLLKTLMSVGSILLVEAAIVGVLCTAWCIAAIFSVWP